MPEVIEDREAVWALISHYLKVYDGDARRVGLMVRKDASETELRKEAAPMVAVKIHLNE